jgi:hypothetical protein
VNVIARVEHNRQLQFDDKPWLSREEILQ